MSFRKESICILSDFGCQRYKQFSRLIQYLILTSDFDIKKDIRKTLENNIHTTSIEDQGVML